MVGPALSHPQIVTETPLAGAKSLAQLDAPSVKKSFSELGMQESLEEKDKEFFENLDALFLVEKTTRNDGDMVANSDAITDIIQLCVGNQKWMTLNDSILLISKKSSAFKESIRKMVEQCTLYVDILPGPDARINLINTLRQVTEGKIYAETERARLTKMLANIYEKDGNFVEAVNVMEGLKVDHIGTMSQREKAEIVIHQMRLYIASEKCDMAAIISKKITKKFLDDEKNDDLKFTYFKMKVELEKESSYLNTCRHCLEIASCISLTADERRVYFTNAAIYCILASYDSDQQDIMLRLLAEKNLKETDIIKIIKLFLNQEIIKWVDFCKENSKYLNMNCILDESSPHGYKCWNELQNRVIEHNIFVISKYYSRIKIDRLGELLDLPTSVCEDHVSRLVRTKGLFARIDRIEKVVFFKMNNSQEDSLNNWSTGLNGLTRQLNKAYHNSIKEVCTQSAHNFSNNYA